MSSEIPNEATRARMARSVLTKNLAVRPGEHVTIEAWTHTIPWSATFAREARRLGANPLVLYEDEAAYWDSLEHGEVGRFEKLGEHEWAAMRASDVYIHMWGPGDRARLSTLPAKVQDRLFAWNMRWYDEARKHGVRGARLEVGRPYPSLAKLYRFPIDRWADQVVRATLVDPARMARSAAPIARAFARGKSLRIRHPNGTDLTLGLAHRRVAIDTGALLPAKARGRFGMLVSLPSGRIQTALDENVADGTIVANRTSYFDDGITTGTTFHFSDGRLTEATFDSGGGQFERPFKSGGKGRDQPGLVRIGLNPALHNTPQLEDVEAGAVMVSVGGNGQLGGKNASPLFGFAITAGAKVEVDGRPVAVPE